MTASTDPGPHAALAALGLRSGAEVRFRRREGGRWRPAIVERIERDGSIGLRDPKGAARAIPSELIEVAGEGPRGGRVWEPLPDVIARVEQLRLL